MKAVYKLNVDFGRMGDVSGVFVAEKEQVDKLLKIKPQVYFGEILGKHSEIVLTLTKKDLKFVTDDEEFIKLFQKHKLENGYDPFDYLDENWDK